MTAVGKDSIVVAAKFLKSFKQKQREEILTAASILPISVIAEAMVLTKAHMGIPWQKLNTMARLE